MEEKDFPFKIGERIDGEWREYRHKDRYTKESVNGAERLVVAASDPMVAFEKLLPTLSPPLVATLVMHTPREEGQEGRYVSPSLELHAVLDFVSKFRGAFERDARADLHVRSIPTGHALIYEKHNYVFACGNVDDCEAIVADWGFESGDCELPLPHSHHYREEFDVDFAAMLDEVPWRRTPLEPGDGD